MATNEFKKIAQSKPESPAQNGLFGTMKPFIKFGIGALSLIASTLVVIVKSIPKPDHSPNK